MWSRYLKRIKPIILLLGTAVACATIAVPAATAQAFDLKPYRGKVVYLDFWASWCAPCRQSFPWMDALQARYGERGLTVVGMNVDPDRHSADEFLQAFKPRFQVLFDPNGSVAQSYSLMGMPETFLIDRTGAVRYKHVGFRLQDQASIPQELEKLLVEGSE